MKFGGTSRLAIDGVSTSRAAIAPRGARWLLFWIAAGIAALVSVTQQSFVYGACNNVFHIPLVLRWAEDPAFANDQVVQSLSGFTSSVWLGLRLVATENNVEWVFYLAHVLTRTAALAALAWASASMGVRGLLPGILLVFWFGIVPALRWETPIGAGDVFSYCFGHTDLAMPLTLAAITLAARRRYLPGFATLGVISHVNAFAAVWAGCAVLGAAIGDKDRRETAVKSMGGLALAIVLSLPVVAWIFGVMESQPVSAVEHERFIHEYFPSHSLLDGHPPTRVALFGAIALSGLIGFRLLSNAGQAWLRAMGALCALVVVGMILPKLVTSRILLDLHLLRASGLIQTLAVLALTAAAVSALRCQGVSQRAGGVLALILLALPALQGVLLAGPVLLAARREDWKRALVLSVPLIVVAWITRDEWNTPILCTLEIGATVAFMVFGRRVAPWGIANLGVSVAAVAVVVTCVAIYTYRLHHPVHPRPEWMYAREAAKWAREATARDAMFLVPETNRSSFSVSIFESLARRRSWVDWKRGGAVMWAPSYHAEWSRRMGEVGRLSSLSTRMAYACKSGIDYVLVGPETSLSDTSTLGAPVYKNDRFQIFETRQWCSK
jgi:hypothetical protein